MTAPTLILPERSHAIASDLRAMIGVDKVKDDYSTLTAYAVDASIYRIAPRAVVLVESEEDIAAAVRYAVERGIPLTPRAAGRALGSGAAWDRPRRIKQTAGAGWIIVRARSLQWRNVQGRRNVGEQLVRSPHATIRSRQR